MTVRIADDFPAIRKRLEEIEGRKAGRTLVALSPPAEVHTFIASIDLDVPNTSGAVQGPDGVWHTPLVSFWPSEEDRARSEAAFTLQRNEPLPTGPSTWLTCGEPEGSIIPLLCDGVRVGFMRPGVSVDLTDPAVRAAFSSGGVRVSTTDPFYYDIPPRFPE